MEISIAVVNFPLWQNFPHGKLVSKILLDWQLHQQILQDSACHQELVPFS